MGNVLTRRPRHAMPENVKNALTESGLIKDYELRPSYQKNDYIRWIEGAKRHATKEKRLHQMLKELEQGGVYMKMAHAPSEKDEKAK